MEARQNDRLTIAKMIAHGAVAGGLRRAAREYPEAARGLLKAAEHHSRRVEALADELPGGVGEFSPTPPYMRPGVDGGAPARGLE